ncbi:TonB family protein [Hymenobacter sp. BT664]|uniref:TonB family protein n=1 Tax=Hymenobacter montanus TaxID=2771359 RepID=A0A927BFK6_9BACT|nr:energy transducer TonB [Hymenobacter montanus]MBD2769018.1 TonB family protein [Hymenobacter montanus]
MRFYTLVAGACLFAAEASAQQGITPIKKEFLDASFHVLPDAVGAYYRREIEQLDSIKGIERTYFIDGRRRSVCEVELRKSPICHGISESWHDNGQLSEHTEFDHGKRVGELRQYYENGQLKRRASYTAPFTSTGECFSKDGQPVPFFEYEQMPVYPDGDGSKQAIVAAIQQRVKYPMDALVAKKSGRVLVSFNVTRKGKVADIKVVQGVFPSLDRAVVQALQKLKPFKPGQVDGKPVVVGFAVPVSFAIE